MINTINHRLPSKKEAKFSGLITIQNSCGTPSQLVSLPFQKEDTLTILLKSKGLVKEIQGIYIPKKIPRLPENNCKVFSWKFCVYCLFFYKILRGSLMGLYQKAELGLGERSLEQSRQQTYLSLINSINDREERYANSTNETTYSPSKATKLINTINHRDLTRRLFVG